VQDMDELISDPPEHQMHLHLHKDSVAKWEDTEGKKSPKKHHEVMNDIYCNKRFMTDFQKIMNKAIKKTGL
jgi:hypothetical protein